MHELVHASQQIMKYLGIDDTEYQAFLFEYMQNQVFDWFFSDIIKKTEKD
jgi:hypothetical protein